MSSACTPLDHVRAFVPLVGVRGGTHLVSSSSIRRAACGWRRSPRYGVKNFALPSDVTCRACRRRLEIVPSLMTLAAKMAKKNDAIRAARSGR